jgi:hypothetical protein
LLCASESKFGVNKLLKAKRQTLTGKMSTSKGEAKIYAVGIICIIAILTAAFVVLDFYSQQNQPPVARESGISSDAVKMTPEDDLHPPVLHSDNWSQPVPLGATVNTAGGEDSPFILPDGDTLYFFFTPNVTIPAEEQVLDGVTGIYVSTKQNDDWTRAERVILQDSGPLALDGAEFVQGDMMWFASAREGYTGVNLFTAEFQNGKWTNWQYVGDKLMKDYQVGEMHITADGSELYFHSSRNGGKGQYDIWVSRNLNGDWQTPENVAAINTQETEGWPFINQDGTELWFTRTYQGSPAVYRSIKLDGVWQTPELIVSQFAGEPTLDNEGNLYFVHHFYNEAGEMVEADIYVALKR